MSGSQTVITQRPRQVVLREQGGPLHTTKIKLITCLASVFQRFEQFGYKAVGYYEDICSIPTLF